jgi:NADH-quinone oxidoreductase subunit F
MGGGRVWRGLSGAREGGVNFVAAPGASPRVQAAILLANPAQTIEAYRSAGGYAALERALKAGDPALVVAEVEAAGLRGRGGAAFPTARKWKAALEHPAPRYLVCNGGEDEPGSLKDRMLMERHPHTLVEGVVLAGWAVGAERAFLYVNETFSGPLAALRSAVGEARAAATSVESRGPGSR